MRAIRIPAEGISVVALVLAAGAQLSASVARRGSIAQPVAQAASTTVVSNRQREAVSAACCLAPERLAAPRHGLSTRRVPFHAAEVRRRSHRQKTQALQQGARRCGPTAPCHCSYAHLATHCARGGHAPMGSCPVAFQSYSQSEW